MAWKALIDVVGAPVLTMAGALATARGRVTSVRNILGVGSRKETVEDIKEVRGT